MAKVEVEGIKKIIKIIYMNLNPKKIKKIIQPPQKHWVGNGFYVHGFFDSFDQKNSPFLLLDYASKEFFRPSSVQRGVGSHPHRGFETVTFAYSGSITHKDSNGSVGTIKEGDVQWMTAGCGVVHQEFFEEGFDKKGGDFEMVQLWVNLPAKFKMSKPRYQEILSEQIPIIKQNDITIKVVAGNFRYTNPEGQEINISGIAKTYSPVNVFQIDFENQANLHFQSPSQENSMLLVLNGDIEVNGSKIQEKSLVIFGNSGEGVNISSSSQAKVLFLSGEALGEPIAHYGPFVMNTESELIQAFEDYKAGKFGQI